LPSEGALALRQEALGGAAKAKCPFCGSPGMPCGRDYFLGKQKVTKTLVKSPDQRIKHHTQLKPT
jgi:hypothetical protein